MRKLAVILCLLMLVGCAGNSQPRVEHRFAQANYQAPKTCLDCGLTEGEALTPDFVGYEIALNEGDVTWKKTEKGCTATLVFTQTEQELVIVPGIEDYYDIKLRDHTETALEKGYSYQVLWQGQRQTVTYRIDTEFSGWQEGEDGMINICTVTWEWDAPDGYDGIVLTLRDDTPWPQGKYLYEVDRTDMLLYRP